MYICIYREIERKRERGIERERQTDRQTDRQIDGQTDRLNREDMHALRLSPTCRLLLPIACTAIFSIT